MSTQATNPDDLEYWNDYRNSSTFSATAAQSILLLRRSRTSEEGEGEK